MNKLELGKKIQALRKASKLTQEELCSKAGVSLQVIKGIEAGSGNPTLESLDMILAVLDLDLGKHLFAMLDGTSLPPKAMAIPEDMAQRLFVEVTSIKQMLTKQGPELTGPKQELIGLASNLPDKLLSRAISILKGLTQPSTDQSQSDRNTGSR